jgi:Ca2+-dependent lipid-binding protein
VQSVSENGSSGEGGTVEVVLVEARDLKGADWRGTSDPYVSARYGNIKKRTKVS